VGALRTLLAMAIVFAARIAAIVVAPYNLRSSVAEAEKRREALQDL
jgi:hypothetical protein